MTPWIMTFLSFLVFWAMGFARAWDDRFVTVAQMQSKGPKFQKGIPLVGHMACLILDALPFPAVMATWVMLHQQDWTGNQFVVAGVTGFILSLIMHLTYVEAGKKFPEFVTYGGRLTPAGYSHVFYMAWGFALIILAYVFSKSPELWLVWLTTAYLIVHVTVGVHTIHKIWTPSWFPYHGMDAGTWGTIGAAAVALLGLTWYALR